MPMISLQVDQKLIDELTAVQKKLGYNSRSEFLRGIMVSYISQNQTQTAGESYQIAIISLTYGIREDIFEKYNLICQNYERLLKNTSQYNLKDYIIKSIIVAGPGAEIHDFYNALAAERNFRCTISYILIPDQLKEKK